MRNTKTKGVKLTRKTKTGKDIKTLMNRGNETH